MVITALVLRLILVFFVFRAVSAPTVDHNEFGWEMGWTARSLVLGHGFSSPFLPLTGATALVPPLFPWLLALVFRVCGLYTPHSAVVILSLNSLFSALTCIPIVLSVRRSVGSRASLLAGWAWVFFPYAIYFSADRVWDYALTGLLFCTCFCISQRISFHSHLSAWFGLGALFGLTCLSNPSIATCLLALFILALYRVFTAGGNWFVRGLVLSVAMLAVIAPWSLRNYRVLHLMTPIRDGLWLEVWAGNNGDTFESNPSWAHPASNPVEMESYKALGEAKYIAEKKVLASQFIKTHPIFFAGVCVRRGIRFWTGFWSLSSAYLAREPLDIPDIFFCTALTVFMLRGLRRFWQINRPAALTSLFILVLFPLPYYVSHSSPDYRQPIESIVIILVSLGVFDPRSETLSLDEDVTAVQTAEPEHEFLIARVQESGF